MEQKKIQDYTVEELKQVGFDLYQRRTQASQITNECNVQLQAINEELVKREEKPVEEPQKDEKAKPKK